MNDHGLPALGDDIPFPKPDNTLRLSLLNENGWQIDRDGSGLRQRFDAYDAQDLDIHGLVEHNLDTTQPTVNNTLHIAAKKTWPHFRLILASSEFQARHFHKPGGTGVIVLHSTCGSITSKYQDPMGRWTSVTLRGKKDRTVSIITCYQVCNQPSSRLGVTASHQQVVFLRQQQRSHLTPREAFVTDLANHIQQFQQQGHEIILQGDMNENLDAFHSTPFQTKVIHRCNLVDVWQARFPDHKPIHTHSRGQSRIDGVFVSRPTLAAVRRIGYRPFQDNPTADHRQVIVDFDVDSLLGSQVPGLASPVFRKLQSKHPESVKAYITQVHSHLEANNFFAQLTDLEQRTEPEPDLAEKLDRLLVQGCLAGEKHCKRVPAPWWSTKLHRQRKLVQLLQALKRKTSKGPLHSSVEQKLQADLAAMDLGIQWPNGRTQIQSAISKARKALQGIIQESRTWREKELIDRIRATESNTAGTKTDSAILKTILKRERDSNMYRKFRFARRGTMEGPLSRLEIPQSWHASNTTNPAELQNPKTASDWITVTTPATIEAFLQARNQKHFGQAEGTPLTLEPLKTQLDWSARSATAELVLSGEFNEHDIDCTTKLLLQHCRQVRDPGENSPMITEESFRGKFQKWAEATTTSPSGRHLGHYKALFAQAFADADTGAAKQLQQRQTALIHAHLVLLNYSLKFGHAFDRWRDIVNVMILKECPMQEIGTT